MKYQVTDNLSHDGKEYKPGSTIEMPDAKQAQALQAIGVLGEPVADKSSDSKAEAKAKAEAEAKAKAEAEANK